MAIKFIDELGGSDPYAYERQQAQKYDAAAYEKRRQARLEAERKTYDRQNAERQAELKRQEPGAIRPGTAAAQPAAQQQETGSLIVTEEQPKKRGTLTAQSRRELGLSEPERRTHIETGGGLEDSRVAKAVQSIGLNTAGSLEMLAEGVKATNRYNKAMREEGVRDAYDKALRELNRVEAIYGPDSEQFEQAQKALEQAKREADAAEREFAERRGGEFAVDQNSRAVDLMRSGAAAQEKALEGASGAGRFLGGAAISMADNLASMAVTGFNPIASAALMGAKAAGSRTYELTEEGKLGKEALMRGVASGAIESLTEKVSLGSLLDLVKNGGKSVAVNLLKQAGVEGAEEATSYILNYAADKLAQDENAKFSWRELLEQTGSGAVSGLGFGLGGTVINRMGRGSANADTRGNGDAVAKAAPDTEANAAPWQDDGGLPAAEPLPKPEMREKDLTSDTRRYLKQYVSQTDRGAVADRLQAVFEAVDTTLGAENEQAKRLAQEAARAIISGSTDNVNPMTREYQALRDYLKTTRFKISAQDAADITDFADWKKANRGNVKISDKGTAVDILYQEMAERWPGLFPAEITHPAAQLERVAEVAEQLKPVMDNPFADDLEGETEYLANEIYLNELHHRRTAEQRIQDALKVEPEPVRKGDLLQPVLQDGQDDGGLPRWQQTMLEQAKQSRARNEAILNDPTSSEADRTVARTAIENLDARPLPWVDYGEKPSRSTLEQRLEQGPVTAEELNRMMEQAPEGADAFSLELEKLLDEGKAYMDDQGRLTSPEQAKEARREEMRARIISELTDGQGITKGNLWETTESPMQEAFAAGLMEQEDPAEDRRMMAALMEDYGQISHEEAEAYARGEWDLERVDREAEPASPKDDLSGSEPYERDSREGTVNMRKAGIRIEGGIADYAKVQFARSAENALFETRKEIRKEIAKRNITDREKRMAKSIAAGEASLDSYSWRAEGAEKAPRRDVVTKLAGMYRVENTFDEHGIKKMGQRMRENFRARVGATLDNAIPQAKKISTLSLNLNTQKRNMLRVFGREAGTKLNREIFAPIQRNEMGRINWVNQTFDEWRKAGLTELNAEQRQQVTQLLEAGEQSAEWAGAPEQLQAAAGTLKRFYNQAYHLINDMLVAHGYDPIGFIENYAPHMQEKEMQKAGSILQRLGMPTEVTELPTYLAGRTENFRPGKQWDPFFLHREGKQTYNKNAVEVACRYMDYFSNVAWHMDDIQRVRLLESTIREEYTPEYLQDEIERVQQAPDMSEDAKERRLAELHGIADNNSKLGSVAQWLEDYANALAGKQTKADRAWEARVDRKALNWAKKPTEMLVRSAIPGNLSSAINQTVQMPMMIAEVGERNAARAVSDVIFGQKQLRREGFFENSAFLTGKRGIDDSGLRTKKAGQKVLDVASIPFEFVDDRTSQIYVRGFYYQALEAGMDAQSALRYADEKATELVGSRMKGDRPMIFQDKNPLSKLATTFQLEVMNQWEHIKYDLPERIKETARTKGKTAAVEQATALFVKASVYTAMTNALIKSATGNTPVGFDWIGILLDYLKDGWEPEDEDEEFTPDKLLAGEGSFDWEAGLPNVRDRIISDMPFGSLYTALTGSGSGRLPLPDLSHIGDTWKGYKRYRSAQDAADPESERAAAAEQMWTGAYKTAAALLPMGNQVKKTYEGAKAMTQGGVYSKDGTQLQYTVEDTTKNWIRALLFGKSALPESQDYYDNGYKKVLSEKQTGVLKEAAELGLDQKAYIAWQKADSKVESDKDAEGKTISSSKERKRLETLRAQKLTPEQEEMIYRRLIASEGRNDKLDALEEAGLSWEDSARAIGKYLELATGDGTPTEKATALAAWADRSLSRSKAEAVKDTLAFWQQQRAEAKSYEKFAAAGLTAENAEKLTTALSELPPEEGKTQPSTLQKYQACIDELSDNKDQWAAIRAVMGSNTKKADVAMGYGVPAEMFVALLVSAKAHDADGNGSIKKDEAIAAVTAIGETYSLSAGEKEVLYHLIINSKSTPFSSKVGSEAYAKLKAAGSTAEAQGPQTLP